MQRRWVPPEGVTIERSGGIQHKLLLEREPVPAALSARLSATFLLLPWWGCWRRDSTALVRIENSHQSRFDDHGSAGLRLREDGSATLVDDGLIR